MESHGFKTVSRPIHQPDSNLKAPDAILKKAGQAPASLRRIKPARTWPL